MNRLSVSARLTLWNTLAVAVLVTLLGLGVSWRVRSDLFEGADRDLRQRADRFLNRPQPGGPPMMEFGGPSSPRIALPPGGEFQPNGGQPFERQRQPPAQGPEGGPEPGGIGSGRRGEPGATPIQNPNPNLPNGEPRQSQPGRGFPPGSGQAPFGQGVPGFGGQGPPMGAMRRDAQDPLRPRLLNDAERSKIRGTDTPWDFDTFQAALAGKESFSTIELGGQTYRIFTRPLGPNSPDQVVQLAHPMSETYRALDGINRTLLLFLPVALVIAAAGGFFITRRALQPVGAIAQKAESISGSNLSARLQTRGNDEFARLGETINAMLDRLESAFRDLEQAVELQRRFTADASHELRSPLAAIKANTSLALSAEKRTEAQYREYLEGIDRSAGRMGVLVSDLLTLARADAGKIALDRQNVDLGQAIETAILAFADKGAPVSFAKPAESVSVLGSELSLVRLFENLLSNAVRHTPKDGAIQIKLGADEEWASIEVKDTGPGLAAEHLDNLGKRFYRADSARSRDEGGFGLGLAICQSIVEAHGGEMSFASEPDQGLTVTVKLPILSES